MGRTPYAESPRYHVLSGRFSEEEDRELRKLAAESHVPISKLVRDVIIAWKEGKYDLP